MHAIKVLSKGHAATVETPVPRLRPGYALVKTIAVALSASDWPHIHVLESSGATIGCDFAGVVQDPNGISDLAVGDRIAGFVHGGNKQLPEDGAYGDYLLVREGLYLKLPASVGFEEAATLPAGTNTVGQGLYQSLKLPLPTQPNAEKIPVLIYGGSTATGIYAIQYAKLSGLEVITTCSPHNFEMVKNLGASAVFDYKDLNCGAHIRKYTNNGLYYVFDCISQPHSAQICVEALSTETSTRKPLYGALLPLQLPREDVEPRFTLGYTATNEAFEKGGQEFAASEEDYQFASKFFKLTQKFFEEGKVKALQREVRNEPLQNVLNGIQEVATGKVSGKKIVYRIADP